MSSKKKIIKNKYTVADFFCGAGGFSEGFHQAGLDLIFSLDNWKLATETHDINHPNCKCVHMNILDITDEEMIDEIIPDVDIIIGSPPCISFSNSNKSGKADKTLGKQLIEQFLKIILYKKTKPNSKLKYWIMENVPNSLNYIKDSYTAKELGLSEDLPDLEIKMKEILKASDYGSPQGRLRAIAGDYILPDKTHKGNEVKVRDICNMLGPPLNNNKQKFKDILFDFEINKEDLTDHFYEAKIPDSLWKKAERLKKDHGYMGKMEFPDTLDRVSRTIMATESYCSREAIIFASEDGDGYRAPSIREISSLMGFPINYQFIGSHSNKHKQIGNAVCVQLSKALGNAILKNDNKRIGKVKQREIVKLNCEQKNSLFENFEEKPKKLNSKYSRHIPYLKINSMRVELDNSESGLKVKKEEYNSINFVWKCYLHKGSGSKAIKTICSNDLIENYVNKDLLDSKLKLEFEGKVYDSKLFQIKNCNIDSIEDHLSPDDVLFKIKDILDEYVKDEQMVKILDIFNKEMEFHPKILSGLYCLNYIIELL